MLSNVAIYTCRLGTGLYMSNDVYTKILGGDISCGRDPLREGISVCDHDTVCTPVRVVYPERSNAYTYSEIAHWINLARADLLFIGLGFP